MEHGTGVEHGVLRTLVADGPFVFQRFSVSVLHVQCMLMGQDKENNVSDVRMDRLSGALKLWSMAWRLLRRWHLDRSHRRLVDWYGVFHAVQADEFLASLPRLETGCVAEASCRFGNMRCVVPCLSLEKTKHPLPKQSCSIAQRSCPCASQLRLQKLKVVQDYNILSVHHIIRR